jgi:hypothetical protein
VCGQAKGLAAIHLREEPDALMSARPGPSGGYPVRGIPTGSVNYPFRPTTHRVQNLATVRIRDVVYGKDLYLHGPSVGCEGGEGGVALGMFARSKNSVMSG